MFFIILTVILLIPAILLLIDVFFVFFNILKENEGKLPVVVRICNWLATTTLIAGLVVTATTRGLQINDIEAVTTSSELELVWVDRMVVMDSMINNQLIHLQTPPANSDSSVILAHMELVASLMAERRNLHAGIHNIREERARLEQQIRTRARSPWAFPWAIPGK